MPMMNDIPPNPDGPRQGWLAALAHLWLLRPVDSAPAGNPLRATLIMAAAWLAAWAAINRWQSQPEPLFTAAGIPLLAWYALAVLALAELLRRQARPTAAYGSMLALAMGAVPVPLVFAAMAVPYLDGDWLLGATGIVAAYVLLYLVRGLRAATGEAQRSTACAGLAFVALFVWLTDALDVIPDVWNPRETQTAQSGDDLVDGEKILFEQAARIDAALGTVSRPAAPNPQAFFLGFAGVGDEKVFAQEIQLASRVLGERYGIGTRSVSLINDERDLQRAPLATVSGLKYALHGLASRMDLDRDVLFLSISSHGTEDPAITVANSQLPLNDLTDEDLAEALHESGIKWRVIIISACYAGGFIESLSDSHTIVITAAAADRTSFGCSNDRDLTYFGEAFYRDALPDAASLRQAFDAAKSAIDARERREHVTPSKPQAYFGAEIQAKLDAMSSH